MAGSIGRVGTGWQAWRPPAAHAAGALAGGTALGGALVAIAAAPWEPPLAGVAAALATLAVAQLVYPHVRVGSRRQVPQNRHERFGAGRALFLHGASLGFGATTQTPSYLYWALVPLAAAAGRLAAGIAGATFGTVRGATHVVLARALPDVHAALRFLSRRRAANTISCAGLAAAAISTFVR